MKRAAIALVWLFSIPAWGVQKNTLTWSASSWTGVVYRVYRSSAQGGPYTRIVGGVKRLQYVDLNVVSKQKLCYRVTAFQPLTKKESGYSPEACGVTP